MNGVCKYSICLFSVAIFSTLFLSCQSQQKKVKTDYFKVASLENGHILMTFDTVIYKDTLKKNLAFHNKDLHFDRVEIKTKSTIGIGVKSVAFHYLLITDKTLHTNVTRYLVEKDGALYINNSSKLGDQFEQMYNLCVGIDDCDPEVFDIDGARSWGCSKDTRCLKETPDPVTVTCRSYKALISSEINE